MKSKIDIIKHKLSLIDEQFLNVEEINLILKVSKTWYTKSDLSKLWIIEVVKRNKYYINKLYPDLPTAESIMSYYFKDKNYMFGGVKVYNNYWFTNQQAQRNEVYNTAIYWKRVIGNSKFIFRKKRSSFFRWKLRKNYNWYRSYVMTKERALIQMILDKKWKIELKENIINDITLDNKIVLRLWKENLSKSKFSLVYSFLND